ncbi:MAG: cytidyltransferase [Planctomycetaceae bacterium]|nr:MAG: cytidyltransferase [Planctomycetaceae bacterium]
MFDSQTDKADEQIIISRKLDKIETPDLPRNGKIKTIQDLAKIVAELRTKNKKIVHCHGVFDLLHIGHIRYFEQAREMGDILVVTVTPDQYAGDGPNHPAFTETQRVETIASLSFIDYVAINNWPTVEETLRLLKPDVYVKGPEYKSKLPETTETLASEEKVVSEIGANIAFTEDFHFSSTNLINRYLLDLPDEINKYLHLFRQRCTLDNVLGILDNMASLNVLVIGDTILDEYQYCNAIGKSSKDPTLALKYQSHDLFAGGILAVANHVANFANKVQLITVIGEHNSHEEFIRSQLHPNISPFFFIQPDAPTLIKRRFIDSYSTNKLFEVYVMDDSGLPPEKNNEVCRWLQDELSEYDLVIAADYGHGAISKEIVRTLSRKSRFLAVNTQANAGNRGLHSVTRYPRADYACIAEHELRLETRTQNGMIRPLMDFLAQKLGCSQFVVTRGRKGCAVCDENGGFVDIPSFAQNIVDRVGAGDAFFSVTSLASALGAPIEVLGFIGNVVGSLAVGTLGNKKSIDKTSVQNYITSLLK